jgi:hypothetical protein
VAKRLADSLQQLDSITHAYGPGCAKRCELVLKSLQRIEIPDVQSLIRFHDTLLFLRAFPQSEQVARWADRLLDGIEPQVGALINSTSVTQAFDDESVSGIAGTTISNSWTFTLARWLVQRHGPQITAQWDIESNYREMGLILPRCLPLLADDSFVEADTPFLKWIETAAGRSASDIQWLLENMARLPVSPIDRASLYDALGVTLQWNLGGSTASRTLARRPVAKLFCHNEPLLPRKQVSLIDEMNSPRLSLRKLSRSEGQKIIEMARDALAVRYRELQGSTYGDPSHAFQADVGRGVQLFIWGLDAEWRLPLRGYFAGFTLKNGIPINYFEAIGLFEWMEVGFNTFYAFREGETAWVYSKVLHLLHQLAGTTCVSVYPYQIGKDNEEAIRSGAFWFYRKQGFRPDRSDLLALAKREERKIAQKADYRTSPRTLRQLAEGHMFLEFGSGHLGRWDTFSTRKIGLAVQQKMANDFNGEITRMRQASTTRLARILNVGISGWRDGDKRVFENFAYVMMIVQDLSRWTLAEKRSLLAIIRAKAGPSETRYLQLLQKHERLREALLKAGSDCEMSN